MSFSHVFCTDMGIDSRGRGVLGTGWLLRDVTTDRARLGPTPEQDHELVTVKLMIEKQICVACGKTPLVVAVHFSSWHLSPRKVWHIPSHVLTADMMRVSPKFAPSNHVTHAALFTASCAYFKHLWESLG